MLAICRRCIVRQPYDDGMCIYCRKPFVFSRWRFTWRFPFITRERLKICPGPNCLKVIPAFDGYEDVETGEVVYGEVPSCGTCKVNIMGFDPGKSTIIPLKDLPRNDTGEIV